MSPAHFACAACGEVVGLEAPAPYACPRRGEAPEADHLLRRVLDPESGWPAADAAVWGVSPYQRFEGRLFAAHLARKKGVDREALRVALEDAIEAVDGRRFRTAPPVPEEDLAGVAGMAPNTVWVKDETGNVSGSHKARHLMGVLLHLQVAEAAGLREPGARLAIASCGNAALAAATLAAAARRPLDVFVPDHAGAQVLAHLEALGATLHPCARQEGEVGDPAYLRFREAVRAGALPFSCQGPDNGLAVEGGITLGYELADALAEAEARGEPIERIFIQVGGGALGSAVMQGLFEASQAGRLKKVPRLHTVQTRGAWPLARAYARVAAQIEVPGDAIEGRPLDNAWDDARLFEHAGRAKTLYWGLRAGSDAPARALEHARAHRGEFMKAWPVTPRSIATGILDDETYEWAALCEAMIQTGGLPLVVDEDLLAEAQALVRSHTTIPADPTGTSGFAGLLHLRRLGLLDPSERCLILFTGLDRSFERSAGRSPGGRPCSN